MCCRKRELQARHKLKLERYINRPEQPIRCDDGNLQSLHFLCVHLDIIQYSQNILVTASKTDGKDDQV